MRVSYKTKRNKLIQMKRNHNPKSQIPIIAKLKCKTEKFMLQQNGSMKNIIIPPMFIFGKGGKAINNMQKKIKYSDFMWINKSNAIFEIVHLKNVSVSNIFGNKIQGQ